MYLVAWHKIGIADTPRHSLAAFHYYYRGIVVLGKGRPRVGRTRRRACAITVAAANQEQAHKAGGGLFIDALLLLVSGAM